MLVISSDNIRMVMRKENHYIFILLMGITIRLGTDKKLNQLHLAKREIRMVRTVGNRNKKKSTVLEQVQFLSTSGDSYQALIGIYLNSCSLLSKCVLSIATSLKSTSTSYPSLTCPAIQPQGTGSLNLLDHLLDQQSQT